MKLVVVGGGGFRTPIVYDAVLEGAEQLGIDQVTLHDVDASRLERISSVMRGLANERGTSVPVSTTTRLDEAVDGATFVFCAIRVGGIESRVVDESVPMAHGILGQETTGPAGICFALRNLPVMLDIAETVATRAPHAWFVNFTNPAGLITESIRDVLGDRAIGICDTPASLCRRVAAVLGYPPEHLRFDYFGLNHLGWLRAVRLGEEDLLPALLDDDERLAQLEEGRLFGAEFLRSLGLIPNEYLYYHYFPQQTREAIERRGHTRAEFLLGQQQEFYGHPNGDPTQALHAWRLARDERFLTYMEEARDAAGVAQQGDGDARAHPPAEEEDRGYAGVAMDLARALALDLRSTLILNTANGTSMPFLDEAAVVEVPCVAGSERVTPLSVGTVPDHCREMIQRGKAVERATIRAALSGSRRMAIAALALDPLVPSTDIAGRIYEAYREQHADMGARFS